PEVRLQFTKEGRKKFADFTRTHVGEHLAIILEGKILSAPVINTAILDGKAVISGGFKDDEEAHKLAEFLNAGALPVPLKVIQSQTVEATIGQVAVEQSKLAAMIGLGLVVLFMLGYYLLPGLVADVALGVYALLNFALYKSIPVTLTLPGIAAFILSIGMAVDANILIFERLKEELRAGKSLHAAIDAGFSRAWTSIFDSNMCTLITCAILGWLGTGPVKGFAFVLALGVGISMFTAIVVTRSILHLVVNTGLGHNPIFFGLGRQWVTGRSGRQLNIVGRMGIWFALSGLIILPGIFFFSQGGLKQGIDFTGGNFLQVKFEQPVTSTAPISEALSKIGLSDSMIQKGTGDSKQFVFIRTKEIKSDAKNAELKSTITGLGGRIEAEDRVGATISKELTANAVKAVILSALLIVLYLTVRFAIGGIAQGFRFGVCAVAATLHDVIVMIGVFAAMGYLFHWEIDLLFVTALLTVIGFSTHDTIVIFDRVRENLRNKVRGESFDTLVNKSILQSFARSINTSFTVVLTLVALLVLGSTNIRHFIVALLVGVVIGTYSSIFNASQLLVLWHRLTGKEEKARAAEPKAFVESEPVLVTTDGGEPEKPSAKAKKRKRRY
ncbi:MAG: protein translocase subunit SecD, partial [Armatimonadota bacterium]